MKRHPLSERKPLFSDVSHASFDPFTLIERVPHGALDSSQGNTQLFLSEGIRFHASLLHEHIHWQHHHGTTVGCFLNLVRYSQDNTAMTWFIELAEDERQKLAKERFGSSLTPIVGIDDSGERYPQRLAGSERLNLFRQIWHDHLVVSKMIQNSPAQDGIGLDRALVFGEVAGDAMLVVHERGGRPLTVSEAIEARGFFAPPDQVFFAKVGKDRVTTELLMEAHATSSELLNLFLHSINFTSNGIVNFSPADIVLEVSQRFEKGVYGAPARSFCALLGLEMARWLLWAPTFHLILDLALNPPLPPVVMTPPLNGKSWEWRELYPPVRFFRASIAVQKIGLLPPDASKDVILTYSRDICGEADLLHWREYGEFKARPRTAHDFNDVLDRSALSASKMGSIDYLFWAQNKLWERRAEIEASVHNPGESTFGPQSTSTLLERMDEDKKWARAPFGVGASGNLGFRTNDSELGNWLLLDSSLGYQLFDVFHSADKLSLDRYPEHLRDSETWRRTLERSLAVSLGVDLGDMHLFAD